MIKNYNQYIKENFEEEYFEEEDEDDDTLENTGAKYGDKVICIRDTVSTHGVVVKRGEIKTVFGGTVTMKDNWHMKINYFTVYFNEGDGVYPGKNFRKIPSWYKI